MTTQLDARGLTCPAPVLLVKDTLEQDTPDTVTVLVDNQASCENVTRFLGTKGYNVTEEKTGDDFSLKATRNGEAVVEETGPVASELTEQTKKILVLVSGSTLGSGDDSLGEKLMVNYLKTIREMGEELWQIIFINGGVKLTVDSSPILSELVQYEQDGVIILACGTCLEHFGLTARKKVGTTTNMLDVVTATQLADKVITIG